MTFKHKESNIGFFRRNTTRVNNIQEGTSFEASDEGYSYIVLVNEGLGDDLPSYKQVIKAHGNAVNGFQGFKQTIQKKQGHSERTVTNYGADEEGARFVTAVSFTSTDGDDFAGDQYIAAPVSDGTAEDIARARFVTKARQATTQFQGGVFLGELRETIHAIKHPADAIRKGLGEYLKTVKKRSRGFKPNSSYGSVRRMLGGTWLEYAFGWAPLMADVKSAAEALAQYNGRFTPPLKVRAVGKNLLPADELEGGVSTLFGDYTCKIMKSQRVEASIYGALQSKIAVDTPPFRGAFGLRARDFVPTVWELIPFSFVTDYFTNVGDILSCGCYDGGDVSWTGMSVKCTTEKIASQFYLIPDSRPTDGFFSTVTGSASLGSFKSKGESLYRVQNPYLIPSLRFSVPGLRQGFNLAALFASATKTSQDFRRSLRIG